MSNENKPKTLKEIKELELLKIKQDTDEIILDEPDHLKEIKI